MASIPFVNSITLTGFQIEEFIVHSSTSAPTLSAGSGGAMWWDSNASIRNLKVYNDGTTSWNPLTQGPTSAVSGNFASFSGTTGGILQDSGISLATEVGATGSDTVIVSEQGIREAITSAVAGGVEYQGTYAASTDTPSLDDGTPIAGILQGDMYIVSDAGNFFAIVVEAGDMLIANQDSPTTTDHWDVVQTNIDIVPVAKGGTGLSTVATDSILVTNTADTFTVLTPSNGQSIRLNAGGTAWEAYTPSTVTQYTDAMAEDAAGGLMTDSTTIDFTYTANTSITGSVISQMSITADASGLLLSGDVASPGATMLYGTNAGGTKGWYAQPTSGTGNAYAFVTADTGSTSASGSDTLVLTSGNTILGIVASEVTNDHVTFTIDEGEITHANIGSLQGGTTAEYYHLTSAQHTIATQAASTTLSGYLTTTDWDTFNDKEEVLSFDATSGLVRNTNDIDLDFTRLTNETALAGTDEFAFYDTAVGMRALTYTALLAHLNSDLTFVADDQDLGYTASTGTVTITDGSSAAIGGFGTANTNYGLVIGSNSVGSTYFLRADGTWAVPNYTSDTNYYLDGVTVNAINDVDFTMTNVANITAIDFSHASAHITGGVDIIPTATASATGLLPVLSNVATQYLNGTGAWSTPPDNNDNYYLSAVTVNSISDVDFTITGGTDVTAVDFSHTHDTLYGKVLRGYLTGSSTSATITHNFNLTVFTDVIVQVWRQSDNRLVGVDIVGATKDTVTISFGTSINTTETSFRYMILALQE